MPFAFKHRPVLNLQDVTANNEQLEVLLAEQEAKLQALETARGRNVLRLATTTGLQANFGTAELKFEAAATAEVKPKHGLGTTPKFLFVSQEQQKTANVWPEYEVPISEANATEFRIFARNVKSEAATAQVIVYWFAIG